MLHAGAIVTITVKGSATVGFGMSTKTDVLNQAVAEIGGIPLTVLNSTIDQGVADTLYNAVSGHWFHFDYVAVITVSVPGDTYDDAGAVGLAVGGAFEDVTGQTPSGVQADVVGAAPAITSASDVVGSGLSGLLAEFHSTELIVVGVVVLAIVALAWGKNIPKLATVHL